MTDTREPTLPAPIALALSVLLHAVVAVLLIGAVAASASPAGIDRDMPTEPPEADEVEVLGIDESRAETLTWIGYDEYEEHLARLSEVEQAALAVGEPAGGGGGGTTAAERSSASPTPPTLSGAARPTAAAPAPTAPATPTDTPEVVVDQEVRNEPQEAPTETPSEVTPATPTEATSSDTAPTEDPTMEPDETSSPRDPEDSTPEATDDTPAEPETAPDKPSDSPDDPEPTPVPDPSPEPTPTPQPTPSPSPSPAPKPEPSDDPGEGEGQGPAGPQPEPGNDADRDSAATSLVDTPQANWRNGKPLAAQGLDLQPRRLAIPLLTWNKFRPSQTPIAEFEFDRDGVPKRAGLVVGSGDDLLDGYIRDALYRWRAKGRRLRELQGDETALVRLRLLLK